MTDEGHSSVVTAVIVTHNSPPIVKRVVEALLSQSLAPKYIVIVDSGSNDSERIRALATLDSRISVICELNIGFAAANNLAIRSVAEKTNYFVLVNPDAVLAPNWIEGACAYLEGPHGNGVGIISSPLRGMDVNTEQPTDFWDSLGIYRRLSGRWYDRGRQERMSEDLTPKTPYQPTAICGALMFFSVEVYKKIGNSNSFFDEKFNTFKEDIEVSLRVRRKGYRLIMLPQLVAWHCRGWPKRRGQAPFWMRKMSARNELSIAMQYSLGTLPIYITKYIYVVTIERWILQSGAVGKSER
jgi:GT2 family glycosyltransferase